MESCSLERFSALIQNTVTMADAISLSIQGARSAAYPQRYVRDCSALIQNPITMAETILFSMRGAVSAAYPQRYVRDEERRRRQKRFSPEGILSLVNFFLILRSRTTEGTLCSLFVGIASNLNIPLSADFKSEHLQRRRQEKSISPKGILSLANLFLSLRFRTTKGTQHLLFVGIGSNLSIPLSSYFESEHFKARVEKIVQRFKGYASQCTSDKCIRHKLGIEK